MPAINSELGIYRLYTKQFETCRKQLIAELHYPVMHTSEWIERVNAMRGVISAIGREEFHPHHSVIKLPDFLVHLLGSWAIRRHPLSLELATATEQFKKSGLDIMRWSNRLYVQVDKLKDIQSNIGSMDDSNPFIVEELARLNESILSVLDATKSVIESLHEVTQKLITEEDCHIPAAERQLAMVCGYLNRDDRLTGVTYHAMQSPSMRKQELKNADDCARVTQHALAHLMQSCAWCGNFLDRQAHADRCIESDRNREENGVFSTLSYPDEVRKQQGGKNHFSGQAAI